MNKPLFFLLLGLSAVLILIGLFLGQNALVLAKAAKVCLECIGIG